MMAQPMHNLPGTQSQYFAQHGGQHYLHQQVLHPQSQENRDFDGEEELFDHSCFEFLAQHYLLGPRCEHLKHTCQDSLSSCTATAVSGDNKDGAAIIERLCRCAL